uniref:Uncharacterized protein n=1 Tax=Ciona savignyi TaxID=51511 RepID=H2YVA0_CIOSA
MRNQLLTPTASLRIFLSVIFISCVRPTTTVIPSGSKMLSWLSSQLCRYIFIPLVF